MLHCIYLKEKQKTREDMGAQVIIAMETKSETEKIKTRKKD